MPFIERTHSRGRLSKRNTHGAPELRSSLRRHPVASTELYEGILGKKPVEASPTFSMFQLSEGMMLGLWSKHTVEPKPGSEGASTELAIAVDDTATVEKMHTAWKKQGLRIAQTPTKMDFGHTFVALDPDGHRLRVFAP